MQEVREKLTKHFENFRFDKTHHLKFGDIKLTIWEQEDSISNTSILSLYFANENNVDESSEDYYNKTYK